MSYAVKKENLATMQSSYALARKVEQNYREMINAQLLNSLKRMSQDDYQAKKMPDNFHIAVLERIKANKGE
ncbi:MAG: hypothetical protein IK065_06590 [Neisseriaceae bacterium]|nr:hypothetical protein [Neisseriaceae bacterium]